MGQSLDLSPNSLLKMMPQLFTKLHYIFEMIRIVANNVVLIILTTRGARAFLALGPNSLLK